MMSSTLLALETSGKSGSVAILSGPTDLGAYPNHPFDGFEWNEVVLDPAYGSAKTLMPAVERLLASQRLVPSSLSAIAIIRGPGSFTGLRVGVATAKAMAYALQIPVVALDGLDVIARQIMIGTRADELRPQRLLAVVDAYRGQMFCAEYAFEGDTMRTVQPTHVVDNVALLEQIASPEFHSGWVGGPGVEKLKKQWEASAGVSNSRSIRWESGPHAFPSAATVARLGWMEWIAGKTEDMWSLLPRYYRSSAAEEKQSQKF